jgi:hypothetical protein
VSLDSLLWACQCGYRSWTHYEFCCNCGLTRPPPPPEAKPDDTARAEPALADLDPA